MPKLPTYTAQIGDINPGGGRRATADDFGGGLGNVGEGLMAAAKTYQNDKEDDESRSVMVGAAQDRAVTARELDEATLSGADLETLKEKMNERLSKLGDSVTTKRAAQNLAYYTAQANTMFDQQANTISVARANITARTQTATLMQSDKGVLLTTPGYLDFAEKSAHEFIDSFSKASPEERARLREIASKDYNMTAVLGSVRLNPTGTKAALEAGEWNLTTEQREGAINMAERAINEKRQETDRQEVQRRQQVHETDLKARNEYTTAILQNKPITGYATDDRLSAESKQNLAHFQDYRLTELRQGANQPNRALENSLWMRIRAPDGAAGKIYDTNEIYKNVGPGRLTTDQADKLFKAVEDQKDENGRKFGTALAGALGVIGGPLSRDPTYIGRPEVVSGVLLALRDGAEKAAEDLRKLGDKGPGPGAVLDPGSTHYFFKPGRVKQIADAVNRQASDALTAGLPRPKTPAERDALPPDTEYLSPSGALAKTPPKKVVAPPSDLEQWMAATGGRLKPGQTQAQAIAEWKARK